MANPSIANKTLPTSDAQRLRRETYISLQNRVSSLELRVSSLCEDVYFEILVKSRQYDQEPTRYVIELKTTLPTDKDKVNPKLHSLQRRIYRLKNLQKQYKVLRRIAMDTLAQVKEEQKDKDVDVMLFERKISEEIISDTESGLASDTDSASESDDELELSSEFDSQEETDFQSESEYALHSEIDAESDTSSEGESEHETDNERELNVEQEHSSSETNKSIISKLRNESVEYIIAALSTRKLLESVFGNEILATHTLCDRSNVGEVSTKPPLNPRKIAYVIHEICSKYEISPIKVRTIISCKCADAAKIHQETLKKDSKGL